jgi:hypothetical protein
LNPTDFAWATVQSLTQKTPKDVKVLVDDTPYPLLERDSVGYVIHLSEPKKVRDNLFSLYGLYFDNDPEGKASLWRMFRASLYHLAIHSAVTDFSIYADFAGSHDTNDALFAISMAEDYVVRGYTRALWPGLVLDEAYGNYLSALRFIDLKSEKDPANLVAANLLSYQMTGKPIRKIGQGNLDRDIETLHSSLVKFSYEVEKSFAIIDDENGKMNRAISLAGMKVRAAEQVVKVFEAENLFLKNVHSLPYTESHGQNYLFDNSVIALTQEKKVAAIRAAYDELSISRSDQKIREAEATLENEGNGVMAEFEYTLIGRQRMLDLFKAIDTKTHFEEFTFPKEDYAQFVRTRAKLIGPIRRVLDQLRMVKNIEDEVDMKESGFVDIPLAIQVVASKSDRTDVFLQEEVEKKSEAWAILVDSSKSLETLKGEARDIAVCLAEVARDLIPDQNAWAVYSFDERMYIVKDFGEIYGNSTKSRIGGLRTGVGTYLPDAIRVVTSRMAKNPQHLKVLLVASDGLPLGYEGIEKDLIDSIEKANRAGIQLIGLGVGSSQITKYFRSNCVIDGPFDLMNHFVRTYYEMATAP